MTIKFQTAYRAAKKAQAVRKVNAGGTVRVFKLKKDGKPYAAPHRNLSGQEWFTPEEAQREADRLNALNPGSKFITA